MISPGEAAGEHLVVRRLFRLYAIAHPFAIAAIVIPLARFGDGPIDRDARLALALTIAISLAVTGGLWWRLSGRREPRDAALARPLLVFELALLTGTAVLIGGGYTIAAVTAAAAPVLAAAALGRLALAFSLAAANAAALVVAFAVAPAAGWTVALSEPRNDWSYFALAPFGYVVPTVLISAWLAYVERERTRVVKRTESHGAHVSRAVGEAHEAHRIFSALHRDAIDELTRVRLELGRASAEPQFAELADEAGRLVADIHASLPVPPPAVPPP
jgi:hypothetical protein